MKANPGHFKPFSKVYGQNSTEEHLPTLTQTSWKCPLADGLKQRYAQGFLTVMYRVRETSGFLLN